MTTSSRPRREEDAAALARLAATPYWLDFVEHQYLPRPEWVGPEATVDRLEAVLRELAPTAVLLPFGLANPDHAATHDAGMLVRERFAEPSWLCYEDSGYKHIPGMLAWRVSQLFRRGVWPTPVALDVDGHDAAQAGRARLLPLAAARARGRLAARPQARRARAALAARATARAAGRASPTPDVDATRRDTGRTPA